MAAIYSLKLPRLGGSIEQDLPSRRLGLAPVQLAHIVLCSPTLLVVVVLLLLFRVTSEFLLDSMSRLLANQDQSV